MLTEAAIWVGAVATVVPTSIFALDDIGPEFHGKKKARISWPVIFGSPGQTRTADQVVNPAYRRDSTN